MRGLYLESTRRRLDYHLTTGPAVNGRGVDVHGSHGTGPLSALCSTILSSSSIPFLFCFLTSINALCWVNTLSTLCFSSLYIYVEFIMKENWSFDELKLEIINICISHSPPNCLNFYSKFFTKAVKIFSK